MGFNGVYTQLLMTAFVVGTVGLMNVEAADCTIAETNNLLIIEAESMTLKGSWSVVEDAVAQGGKYIHYTGANSYNSVNNNHTCEVKFTITNTGTYNVFWCMRQPDEAEGDKSNDAWVNFPDAIQRSKDAIITGFHKFVGRAKGTFQMNGALDLHTAGSSWLRVQFDAPGEYTLQISGRSEFFQLDRICISKGRTFEELDALQAVTAETRIGCSPPAEPGIPAMASVDGTNIILSTTNGTANSWFTLLSKTNLADTVWTTNQISLPIDGTGHGAVTNLMSAPCAFYKLVESMAPPAPVIEFIDPYYSDAPLNGQQYWNAESGWTVSDSAGVGYASTPDNNSAAVLNDPIQLSVGQTYSLSINLQFGGSYTTPTNYVYAFLAGLKDSNAGASVGTGDAVAADANIQLYGNIDTYRLLSNYTPITGITAIDGALNDGDILQFDYELTLGADAASTTYSVRLQNLTDAADTGTGTVSGIHADVYTALTGSGAYGFFQSINPGYRGSGLSGVQVNSVTTTTSP